MSLWTVSSLSSIISLSVSRDAFFTVYFQATLDKRLTFITLEGNWNAHAFYLSARSCASIYRVRESKSKSKLFHQMFIDHFAFFFCSRHINHMLKGILKLLLHIRKWFNAFQVLEWFSFLLNPWTYKVTHTPTVKIPFSIFVLWRQSDINLELSSTEDTIFVGFYHMTLFCLPSWINNGS